MEYNGYEEKQQTKFRSRILIGVLIVLVMVLFISAAVLIMLGMRQSKYNSAMKNANHYFTAGDYQNAIVEYENAIAIDKKKESAYLNLASVYITIGDYESAKAAVERGLDLISSDKLEQKMVEIEYLVMNAKNPELQTMTVQEIQEYSAQAGLENNIFDMVAAYTYTEYFRDFGNVSSVKESDKVVIDYVNGGIETSYYNVEGEKVLNDSQNMPYATAKPAEVSVHNLYKVFSTDSERFAVSYEKLQELFGDSLELYQDEQTGMYYITAEYKKCRISVETDENGNIVSETAWNKLEPLNRSRFEFDEEAEGEVQGYVQDAMTGKGMKATMKVRERGKKTGTVIKELISGRDGSYTYGGDHGIYTIEVSARGYITEYFDVEIIKGQIKTGNNIVLSPEVAEGEIRIVLTWGSSPTDLDSYAIGRSSSGHNFNINFTNRSVEGVGNLDVDDTSCYGPETITITDTGANFEYRVVDFRTEGTLGGSGATVKVYLPGESSAIEFKVPEGSGVIWDVFEYENGEIKKINRMSDEVPTRRVTK